MAPPPWAEDARLLTNLCDMHTLPQATLMLHGCSLLHWWLELKANNSNMLSRAVLPCCCACLGVQAKARSWLAGGLFVATAAVISWRFASSSIGRFASAFFDHRRRK